MKGGYVAEALMDLTGCPTSSYNLRDDFVQHFIQNGQFWELIKYFHNEGYMLSMSTPGEERWGKSEAKGEAFAITQVKDIGAKLVCLRSPLTKFEWTGDFSEGSPSWTKEILSNFDPKTDDFDPLNPENDQNIFWMCYEDMLKNFSTLNVCKAVNMHETRIKGKFLRM